MNRREFVKSIGCGAAAVLVGSLAEIPAFGQSSPKKDVKLKPNFLFILLDDLGWSQVGCYGPANGGFYETPNIDQLASEGMKFTDAYAACPVCSPTRASIMTGKYPARLHVTDYIPGDTFPYEKLKQPEWQKYLPLEEVTIAEFLKSAGYVTASFGKWHLSVAKKPPESELYDPDKQGFDETLLTEKPASKQDPEKDAHNVDLITEKSLEFLERNKDKPFFLYVAHNTIHAPIMGKKKLVEKYKGKSGSDLPENNPVVGAMLEELDSSIGKLLKRLDELKIADKTIVIFFSDNGGLEAVSRQTPLRSGKANLYEGGIRVPFIVRWPGVVKPGTICSEPVISVDFFPTFVEIVGLENKMPKPIDGVSLVTLLTQRGVFSRQAIYWHYPHYHSAGIGPCGAIRSGNYKLIEWFDETICGTGNRFELYNLKEDAGEQNNLAGQIPQKVDEMRKMLANWRDKVNAQMLTPNPSYNPQKAKKSKRQE
jgi:arylsulfatase A-like enzyme